MYKLGMRFKILSFFLILILTLTFLSSFYHSNRMEDLVFESANDIQTKFVQQIGFSIKEPLDYELSDEVSRLIERVMKGNKELKYVYIYNSDNLLISKNGKAVGDKFKIESLKGLKETIYYHSSDIYTFYAEYLHPIYYGEELRFILRIGFDNTKYQASINKIIEDYLILIVSVVTVVLIFGYFFFKSILLVPLDLLLNRMIQARAKMGDSNEFVVPSSKDEVDYIGKFFDSLINLIEKKNVELTDLNVNLEKKVEQRTQELKDAQDQLLESAHMAGMATMAAGVLHNIGNILTLTSNTGKSLSKSISKSPVQFFDKITEHSANTDLSSCSVEVNNIISAYKELGEELKKENKKLVRQADSLCKANETMVKTVQAQQKYAHVGEFKVEVSVNEIIEDSIELLKDSISRHRIDLTLNKSEDVIIKSNKTNLMNVFVNILMNAKESVLSKDGLRGEGKIDINIEKLKDRVKVSYVDNGIGISKENLENIFHFGFTTKKTGSGFGLHDAVNTINELDGKLEASSEGEGHGATFSIEIPFEA